MPKSKQQKREEALARNQAYAALPFEQKLAQAGKKVRAKLEKRGPDSEGK